MRNERDREILRRVYILEEPREIVRRDLDLDELHFNRVLHRARERFRDFFLKG
jgi:RNA polymerase sigma-70 factor (ECF subfamily)